jgi:hypothetical protein
MAEVTTTGPAQPVSQSLLDRATTGDKEAIRTMFKQFLGEDEEVLAAEYLGIRGLWIFGMRSFACLTERRIATIRAKLFGEIEYQDASLEWINSGVVLQPSRLALYLFVAASTLVTFGLALVLLPLTVRTFYRFKKCGLVLWVREGVPIYIFSDRKFVRNAMSLYRTASTLRESRIRGSAIHARPVPPPVSRRAQPAELEASSEPAASGTATNVDLEALPPPPLPR